MNQIQLTQMNPEELQKFFHESVKSVAQAIVSQVTNSKEAEETFLSIEETRKFFGGVARETIHGWTKKGLIKAYKMGNRTYYKKSELIERLEQSNNH